MKLRGPQAPTLKGGLATLNKQDLSRFRIKVETSDLIELYHLDMENQYYVYVTILKFNPKSLGNYLYYIVRSGSIYQDSEHQIRQKEIWAEEVKSELIGKGYSPLELTLRPHVSPQAPACLRVSPSMLILKYNGGGVHREGGGGEERLQRGIQYSKIRKLLLINPELINREYGRLPVPSAPFNLNIAQKAGNINGSKFNCSHPYCLTWFNFLDLEQMFCKENRFIITQRVGSP
jgi:hypothetical protein